MLKGEMNFSDENSEYIVRQDFLKKFDFNSRFVISLKSIFGLVNWILIMKN